MFVAVLLALSPFQLRAELGADLYQAQCSRCHGTLADGGRGGDIRRSSLDDVLAVLDGHDNAPRFRLTAEEAAALQAYLAALDAQRDASQ